MNKTRGCISARCPCKNRGVLMLNSCLHNKLKAEAERPEMLKILLKIFCRGALWWLCPPTAQLLEDAQHPFAWLPSAWSRGGGSASEPLQEPGAPGAAPAAAESLGEGRRWVTHSCGRPLPRCKGSPRCRHKNAELTPPVADQNPILTRQNPLLMRLGCTLN